MKHLKIAFAATLLTFSNGLFAAPVEFQKIPEIMDKFENAQIFVKKAKTLGRLPTEKEIGSEFPTYVSDGKGGYSVETRNLVSKDVVIASKETPIVDDVYNQWLVPKTKWVDTYGQLPDSTEFQSFKRIKTIKAIKIDSDMLKLMGSEDGQTATIKVSWSDDGMKVYKDGYLANYEYGIAPEEMEATYELVE
ncbi:hypothetical protein F0231_07770 [Vibrio sp. RE86]|uniref:hypothetical protein n=1 Tax=Vibrio sp. RE86 TaxID=2607605 RepID=UPI0014936AA2|nr:hypothetical protein [Vibrio sp. RE86]NOH79641.1 hypothetical protein [Vibrio sp. RE86]